MKAGLDHDVCLGVLEEVPIGTLVSWCHRMVICAKKNGKPHRRLPGPEQACIPRNPPHAIPVPPGETGAQWETQDCVRRLETATTASHCMRMTATRRPSSPHGGATGTFRPHKGTWRSWDGYSRRYDEVVADIGNKTKCVDDTLLWADTIEESYFQAIQWLDVCGQNSIILNPEKFVAAPTVDFAGFTITV